MTLPETKKPTLADLMQESVRTSVRGVRCCVPGTLVALKSPGVWDVRVSVDGLRNGEAVTEPTLLSVPLLSLGSLRAAVTPPPLPGDVVLLLFADRDIDRWKAARGATKTESATERTHDITDCVAVPIMWGQATLEMWSFLASAMGQLSTSMTVAAPLDPVMSAVVSTIVGVCSALPVADPAKTFATALELALTPLIVTPDSTASALAPILTALSNRLLAAGVTPG